MSPDFYAHLFYDYGFDFIGASQFPRSLEEEILPERILNPKDKPVIVRNWCNQLGLEMNNCVAFGDSMSDYLLFKELEHTVAVNGDATLRTLARYRYDGVSTTHSTRQPPTSGAAFKTRLVFDMDGSAPYAGSKPADCPICGN